MARSVVAFAIAGLTAVSWVSLIAQRMDAFVGSRNHPAIAYGSTFVLGLISAALFATIIGPHPSLGFATGLGFAVGLCFVAAAIGTNYLFERRPLRLFLINAGFHTLRCGLIGFTFGLIG